MKRTALPLFALTTLAGTIQTAHADSWLAPNQQAQSQGVIADSEWQLDLRTQFENRDYRNGATSNGGRNRYLPRSERSDYAREWGLGVISGFESGFTEGVIGFGVDAQLYMAQKLDASDYSVGKIRSLPMDGEGYAQDNLIRGGAAFKMRMRNTQLRYGEQRIKTPVFSASDSRLLPESMYGFYLESQDLNNFVLQAGHFTGSTDRNARSTNNPLTVNYANPDINLGNSFDLLGLTYSLSPNATARLFSSELEDSWRTHYFGFDISQDLGDDRTLSSSLNLYQSRATGEKFAGKVDNTTGSLLVSYRQGMHKVGVAYQKVDGDTPFDYVTRGAIWLANASQLSDFNAPNESSWQLRYNYDFSALGMPGLTAGANYTRGTGIDGSHVDPNGSYAWLGYGSNGKHWERDLNLSYTVQQGAAKGTKLALYYSTHRSNADQAELDADQIKVRVQYPLSRVF